MQCEAIFEEKTETTHSVVWESQYIIHITVSNGQFSDIICGSELNSTNRLQLYSRDDLRDDFKYEILFHVIAELCRARHLVFTIYYFDDIDDMKMLNIICMYFNRYYGQSLTIESGEAQYVVKNGAQILLQSFF